MSEQIAQLRNGDPVGAWVLKAKPSIWDIGSALAEGVELDWWRLAPSYRADLVTADHPCAMWVTRGDPSVAAGFWAIGRVTGPPVDDVGDPDDDLWRDRVAQQQLRPRIPVELRVLESPVTVEEVRADPRLRRAEIVRVPRMGNPAVLSPQEWQTLLELVER